METLEPEVLARKLSKNIKYTSKIVILITPKNHIKNMFYIKT